MNKSTKMWLPDMIKSLHCNIDDNTLERLDKLFHGIDVAPKDFEEILCNSEHIDKYICMYILDYQTASTYYKNSLVEYINNSNLSEKFFLPLIFEETGPLYPEATTLGYLTRETSELLLEKISLEKIASLSMEYARKNPDKTMLPFAGTHVEDIIFERLTDPTTKITSISTFFPLMYYSDKNAIHELITSTKDIPEGAITWLFNNKNINDEDKRILFQKGPLYEFISTKQPDDIIFDIYNSALESIEDGNGPQKPAETCIKNLIQNKLLPESCQIDVARRILSKEPIFNKESIIDRFIRNCTVPSLLDDMFNSFCTKFCYSFLQNNIVTEEMLKHYADIVLKKEEFSENEFIFLNDVIKKVTLNHMDDYKKIADKNVMSIAGSAYTPPEALNYLNDKHFNNSFANVARAQAELNLKLREQFSEEISQKILNSFTSYILMGDDFDIRENTQKVKEQYFPTPTSDKENYEKIKSILEKIIDEKQHIVKANFADSAMMLFAKKYLHILEQKNMCEVFSNALDSNDLSAIEKSDGKKGTTMRNLQYYIKTWLLNQGHTPTYFISKTPQTEYLLDKPIDATVVSDYRMIAHLFEFEDMYKEIFEDKTIEKDKNLEEIR